MIEAFLLLPAWVCVLLGLFTVVMFFFVEFESPGPATIVVAVALATVHFGTEVDIVEFATINPLWTLLLVLGYFVSGAMWSVGKWWFYVRRLRDEYDRKKGAFLRQHNVPGDKVPEELKERFIKDVAPDAYHVCRGRLIELHQQRYQAAMAALKSPVGTVQTGETLFERAAFGTGLTAEELRDWSNLNDHGSWNYVYVLRSSLPDSIKNDFRDMLAGPQIKAAIVPNLRDHKSRVMIWMVWWPWSMAWTLLNDPVKRAFRAMYRVLQGLYRAIAENAFRRVDNDIKL